MNHSELFFFEIVLKIFSSLVIFLNPEQYNQILFSYLKNGNCIGYGGLVHIDWIDKNAEISFIMNTNLEEDHFHFHWSTYLKMIEFLAFEELSFHKLYVYAFDLRPHLYKVLLDSNYFRDAILNGSLDDVLDFFPKELSRQEILKIVKMLKQGIIAEMVAEKIEDIYSGWFDENTITESSSGIPLQNTGTVSSEDRANLANQLEAIKSILDDRFEAEMNGD